MNPQIIQNLRYKLEKRFLRLKSVNGNLFIPSLKQFWVFFHSNPNYVGITDSLLVRFPEVETSVESIFQGKKIESKSEEEAAAVGYAVLRRTILNNDQLHKLIEPYRFPASYDSEDSADKHILEVIRYFYLEPLYSTLHVYLVQFISYFLA